MQRICPGMHVAEHTMVCHILLYFPLYLMVLQELTTMRLLWAFDFHPAIDQVTGQPIKLDLEDYTSVRSNHCYSSSVFDEDLDLTRTSPLLPAHSVAKSLLGHLNVLMLLEGLSSMRRTHCDSLRRV